MSNSQKISIGLIVLSFLIGAYFYNSMPATIASHWGLTGQANGYVSKFWGLFVMPLISAALYGLFILLPKIDPLKANYAEFKKYYDNFIAVIIGFLFYIHALTVIWNLGTEFNMTQAITPAFAFLFYYIGVILEHTKPNWFLGIRTPWTLSSPKVWQSTHKRAAQIFKLVGLLILLSFFLGAWSFAAAIALLLIASLYLVIYSYLEFKKLK